MELTPNGSPRQLLPWLWALASLLQLSLLLTEPQAQPAILAAGLFPLILLLMPRPLPLLVQAGLVGMSLCATGLALGSPPLTLLALLSLAAIPVLQGAPLALLALLGPALILAARWAPGQLFSLQSLLVALTAAVLAIQGRAWQRRGTRLARRYLRLRRQLRKRGNRDRLTGLYARHYFDDRLIQAVAESRRSKLPLALILVEVDYFERYNDRLGDDHGDRCLMNVAQLLRQTCHRDCDLLARFTGYTFAILLPATDRRGAARLARQLSESLAQAQIPHPSSPIQPVLTLSQGISQWQPGSDGEQLLRRALHTLRRARLEGRNQVLMA
ncbi:GGDEF domain-containing protein [Ferrimonas marina]|uniref:diguanylate cyclase n=1 Tax=Ferrimonas marina TaxID=299255 RepID=A0A1M5XRU4_9GAMM|nr:diguanylate cyclase [Ferrimonas marina]SHI02479.1 diguanylate cyclase (GGDEF) domain-containing protein [Ferrimonas marina]